MANVVTAFDLTPSDCKVVQLSRQKTLCLRRALLIPFTGITEEGEAAVAAKAQRVKEALRLHKVQATNPVLVVPKHSAIVRTVSLPSTDPEELEGMARFEAEKIIPFNVERHVISHAVLSQESIGGTRVLLTAIDEPIISESLHVLTQAGIEPVLADVSSLSLLTAWRRSHPEPPEGVLALVNIGSVHTDITIAERGNLLTTRSVLHGTDNLLTRLTEAVHSPRPLENLDLLTLDVREPGRFRPSANPPTSSCVAGGAAHVESVALSESTPLREPGGAEPPEAVPQSPSDPPTPRIWAPEFQVVREDAQDEDDVSSPAGIAVREWIGRLLSEIRRTYDFARREFEIGGLQLCFLSGEGALIQGLEQTLTVTLGAEVSPFVPLSEYPAPAKPLQEIDVRLLPVFSIASGGALHGLWSGVFPLNILPSEMIERQERQALRLSLMLLGAMVLIALTLGYRYVSGLYRWQEEKVSRYEQYNRQMSSDVKRIKEMEEQIGILEQQQRDRASALAILDAISAYPKVGPVDKSGRLTITSFNYDSEDEVNIEGDALDITDINDFVTYLINFTIDGEKVFRHVQIRQHTPESLPGRPQVFRYQLVGFLEGTGATARQ